MFLWSWNTVFSHFNVKANLQQFSPSMNCGSVQLTPQQLLVPGSSRYAHALVRDARCIIFTNNFRQSSQSRVTRIVRFLAKKCPCGGKICKKCFSVVANRETLATRIIVLPLKRRDGLVPCKWSVRHFVFPQ